MHSDALAALVRAVARLRPTGPLDPALVRALADLLVRPAENEAKATERHRQDEANTATAGAADRAAAGTRKEPAAQPPMEPLQDGGNRPNVAPRRAAQDPNKLVALASSLAQVAERADLAAPRRGSAASTLAVPRAVTDMQGPVAPLESLFPAGRVRAILRDMATVTAPSGQVDVAAAVAMMARAEPIRALPQRVRSALGHTILMLFDAGPAMLPFARDKQQLAATSLRLLGRDRVRVSDFIGDPGRGVRAQRQVRWELLRWPGRGSTIMVVSDLGISAGHGDRQAAHDQWAAFLDEADRRGLRSVVLIPYDRPRWPAVAARFGVALAWDLATGVQALRRSARAHR